MLRLLFGYSTVYLITAMVAVQQSRRLSWLVEPIMSLVFVAAMVGFPTLAAALVGGMVQYLSPRRLLVGRRTASSSAA